MYPLLLKLIENNELAHASINVELKKLKPINSDYLFATDNISFSIICALSLAFPKNSIRMQTYNIFGNQYVFTSIAKEHDTNLTNRQIKLYFFSKNDFKQNVKIESKLSKNTFNIIKTPGYEYITLNELFPNKEIIVTINNLVNYTTHNIKDSRTVIIIKAFINYFIYQKKSITRIS